MKNWKETINVEKQFSKYLENDEIEDRDFLEIRNQIVEILHESKQYKNEIPDENYQTKFRDLVLELENAEEVEEFDFAWSEIYDYCDENLIWIKTF
jgi:hypothetical protein